MIPGGRKPPHVIPMESPYPARETPAEVPAICHIPPKPVSPAGKRIVLLIAILARVYYPL